MVKKAASVIRAILEEWKNSDRFRTAARAASWSVTVLFALYNGFLGLHLSSAWHGSIGIFYLLLAAVRGLLLWSERSCRDEGAERRRQRVFRINTVILLALNLALIGPISLMVLLERPVNIGLVPAIAMAAYTTYKVTAASIRFKRRRSGGGLMAALWTVNFVDALVSVLTLQNTLIMVKSGGTRDLLALSAVSSGAIYAVIILTTVRLLISGWREDASGRK